MEDHSALLALLACPRCDQPLKTGTESMPLRCPGCRTEFPAIGGLPWLFAHPEHSLAEWRERSNFALTAIGREAQEARRALGTPDLLPDTRRRLELRVDALASYEEELRDLLGALSLGGLKASYESYLALRTRLPTEVSLTGYEGNPHRDWCWGAEENRLALEAVSSAFRDRSPDRLLVLGAGAGRLAYDVHMARSHALTIALDHNPMLLLAASRIARGETLPLHEFPLAPRHLEDSAIARELSAPAPARDGLEFILASAQRPPFMRDSFDLLLTPWLVDVLDEDLRIQARRWNALLVEGGRWIWFGSASFRSISPAECYSLEEALEIICGAGFGDVTVEESVIPYMDSPVSRYSRRECVVTVVATKERDIGPPPRHVALPDWIVTGEQPVPALESFRVQAMSTRIHAFMMGMIDGKRSIRDMARLLERERLMTREEGEAALRGFLIKMYEESRRSKGL